MGNFAETFATLFQEIFQTSKVMKFKPTIRRCTRGWECVGRGVAASGHSPQKAYGLWMVRVMTRAR